MRSESVSTRENGLSLNLAMASREIHEMVLDVYVIARKVEARRNILIFLTSQRCRVQSQYIANVLNQVINFGIDIESYMFHFHVNGCLFHDKYLVYFITKESTKTKIEKDKCFSFHLLIFKRFLLAF